MAQFSRRTILAATDIISNWGHDAIDRFLLEHGLENAIVAPGAPHYELKHYKTPAPVWPNPSRNPRQYWILRGSREQRGPRDRVPLFEDC